MRGALVRDIDDDDADIARQTSFFARNIMCENCLMQAFPSKNSGSPDSPVSHSASSASAAECRTGAAHLPARRTRRFSDSFRIAGPDSNARMRPGNAVPVPMVRAVIKGDAGRGLEIRNRRCAAWFLKVSFMTAHAVLAGGSIMRLSVGGQKKTGAHAPVRCIQLKYCRRKPSGSRRTVPNSCLPENPLSA